MSVWRMLLGMAAWASAAAAGEPVHVVSGSVVADAQQPQVAVDPQGVIYVVFGSQKTIYCSASADEGRSYGDAVQVASGRPLALGMRRGPRVAVASRVVVVTAVVGELGGGQDGDLAAWRSTDQGATWQGPTLVNDVQGAAREGLHAMAAGPDGQLCCVWLDLRSGKTEIFASVSADQGMTWSKNLRVYRSPSGSVCECCHPSVAYDAEGGIYVMWRNSLDGFRDMYASVSRDAGATFSRARKLGTGTWRLDHCPMDGGALAVTGKNQVTTVWRREKQIFATAGGQERSLGAGEQPWAASNSEGAYLVWISQRQGDLWMLPPTQRAAVKLAEQASDPAVAVPLGRKGPVVVVWESGRDGNSMVMAQVIDSP
jgi:BNR repeat-like domain